MPETMKNMRRRQENPRNRKEQLTNEQIKEGFELLQLGHLWQIPYTTPNDFASSFKRCSVLKSGFVAMKSNTGA